MTDITTETKQIDRIFSLTATENRTCRMGTFTLWDQDAAWTGISAAQDLAG